MKKFLSCIISAMTISALFISCEDRNQINDDAVSDNPIEESTQELIEADELESDESESDEPESDEIEQDKIESGEIKSDNEIWEWYLEPSVEADDIIVVDTDESTYDKNYADQLTSGFASADDDYSVFNYVGYRVGGKIGIMDYNGSIIESEEKKNAVVFINGKFNSIYFYEAGWPGGFGSVYEYDESTKTAKLLTGPEYSGSYAVAAIQNSKYGIYKNGQFIVLPAYENGKTSISAENGINALCENGKWGYFDNDGNQIIDFVCDGIQYYPNGILDIVMTGRGLDAQGDQIEELNNSQYTENVFLGCEGYIPVKINGEWSYFNYAGEEVTERGIFAEIRPVHNGLAWVKDKETGSWGVIQFNAAE